MKTELRVVAIGIVAGIALAGCAGLLLADHHDHAPVTLEEKRDRVMRPIASSSYIRANERAAASLDAIVKELRSINQKLEGGCGK